MDILCNNINCNGIGLQRADWQNFRECWDIVLNGQVIWERPVLSHAVKSRIYEDIVTTGHHSASLAAEVWRAANSYCKAHKLAHPELTSQGKLLSNFVNADPDLYCSLPLTATPEALYAMPVRSLVVSGNAYAMTKNAANQDTFISFKGTIATTKSGGQEKWHTLFAADASVRSKAFGIWANDTAQNGTLVEYNNNFGVGENISLNRRFYAESNKNVTKVKYIDNDQEIINRVGNYGTFTTPSRVGLFMLIRNGSPLSEYDGYLNGTCEEVIVKENGVLSEHYLPSKISNTMELLDLETLTLATRVGTFTEQKDIPIS